MIYTIWKIDENSVKWEMVMEIVGHGKIIYKYGCLRLTMGTMATWEI